MIYPLGFSIIIAFIPLANPTERTVATPLLPLSSSLVASFWKLYISCLKPSQNQHNYLQQPNYLGCGLMVGSMLNLKLPYALDFREFHKVQMNNWATKLGISLSFFHNTIDFGKNRMSRPNETKELKNLINGVKQNRVCSGFSFLTKTKHFGFFSLDEMKFTAMVLWIFHPILERFGIEAPKSNLLLLAYKTWSNSKFQPS